MSLLTVSNKRIFSSVRDCSSAHRVHMHNPLKRIHKNRSSLSVSSCNNYFSWNKVTDGLVSGANIPFSILVLPQVIQNFKNMSSGNLQALSIISWEVGIYCSHAALKHVCTLPAGAVNDQHGVLGSRRVILVPCWATH